MDNPIWFVIVTFPGLYLSTLFDPFALGLISAVFAFGAICLLIGTGIGLRSHRRSLFLFLIPFGLSELLVAVANAMRGRFSDGGMTPIILVFLGAQLLLVLVLIWRLRQAWVAPLFLSLFSLSYALFAAFAATIALAGGFA